MNQKNKGYRLLLGNIRVILGCVVILAGCFLSRPQAAVPSDSIMPMDSALIEASYYNAEERWRVFWPKGVEILRGILIDENELNHDKSIMLHHWGFGMLYYEWRAKPDDAAGMQAVFDEAAEKSGHPEFKHAPFLSYGYSRNTNFPRKLTGWFPERSIAYHAQWDACLEGGKQTPRIMIDEWPRNCKGDYECMDVSNPSGTNNNSFTTFRSRRAAGEPVAYAPQWSWGHGFYSSRDMEWPWFDAIIQHRVPEDADPRNGQIELKDIAVEDGWLGDCSTWFGEYPRVYPYDEYPGDKSQAAWLPDARTAKVWQAYVSRHPTLENNESAQWGVHWVGGSSGNFGGLHAPPSVAIGSPTTPFRFGPGGKDYIGVPVDTAVNVTVRGAGIDGEYDPIKMVRIYDCDILLAELPGVVYKFWQTKCKLSVPGVRSLIVELELEDGRKVIGHPSTIHVMGDGSESSAVREQLPQLRVHQSNSLNSSGRLIDPRGRYIPNTVGSNAVIGILIDPTGAVHVNLEKNQ